MKQDLEQAKAYYRAAANRGNRSAQEALKRLASAAPAPDPAPQPPAKKKRRRFWPFGQR